ncbi:hypothetical protein R70241_03912 [Paraburkholderia saeva]|nr:hypothetical protein R70241_03912 [Paraburkholderia saeva]
MRFEGRRDINTLFTYLNNLHSLADKLKESFGCDIKSIPEFKLLRMVRNYFHHIGDVDEIRLNVRVEPGVIVSHSQHVIIPLEVFAKSVRSFIDNNTVDKKNRNYVAKQRYVTEEMAEISLICDDCAELLRNLKLFCTKPSLSLDGVVYELGFDMFKFIYNITNVIADSCRLIDVLKGKRVVEELDESYTATNNIAKRDVLCSAETVPITTTEGFIYARQVSRAELWNAASSDSLTKSIK